MRSVGSLRFLAAVVTAALLGAAPAAQDWRNDGVGATLKRFDHLNRGRYIEIFLAHKDETSGNVVSECYNTMFRSNAVPASKDTAPQALVEGIDLDKIAKEHGALAARLNGPKLWMLDWIEIPVGAERDFNGMKAPWVATLKTGEFSKAYTPMTIARKSALGYNKGTTVFLIDDAQGTTWIMKGFDQGLKPAYTYDEFLKAGASRFTKLPPGWKFRIKVLDQDLVLVPKTGIATIMPDEFFNVYDKTGPGYSNYVP